MGKVYGNLMVDVRPSNEKLQARALRIVHQITELDHHRVRTLLDDADWDVKTAVVMGLMDLDADSARRQLARANGRIHAAVTGHTLTESRK